MDDTLLKRCVVHIGMQKSGSASIQQSLKGFSDDRFFYARLDSANHGRAMLGLFAPEEISNRPRLARRPEAADVAGFAARAEAALSKSIDAAQGRTLVISGESISVMPPDGLARMRDYLSARFDEVTIAGYVRPPGALMSSRFQQRVRSGALKRFSVERQYPGYRRIFGSFDGIFGRERVHFWKFDPASFPDGCVVRDFCSRIGIALPADRITRRNESLTRHAVSLIYTHRMMDERCGFPALQPSDVRLLAERLAALGGDKFRLSPEVVAPVLARQQADIEWMEQRLGESLQENLGDHRPGDVRCETDLLDLASAMVNNLAALTGTDVPAGGRGTSQEQVAWLVQRLREQSAARTTSPQPA